MLHPETDLQRLESLHELLQLLGGQEVSNEVLSFPHLCQRLRPLWRGTEETQLLHLLMSG